MLITSLNNEHIKELNKLKEKKYRDEKGLFLVEGHHLVEEAYKKGAITEIILLEDESFNLDVPTIYVTKEVMKKLSDMESPSTVIGVAKKKKEEKIGKRILILDGVQDPGNLGTIIRSACAFDIDTIVLSPNSVNLYNPKVVRATKGMLFHINVIVRELDSFIREIKKDNYVVYGTKVTGGEDIKEVELPSKFSLVIGSEGQGMSMEVSNLCDKFIYIKMNGKVESLNAGVATSILLYEVYKKNETN